MGSPSLNKEVLLHPGETSHVGKHLSVTVVTSLRQHRPGKLTLCTEVCTSRPSSAPPEVLGLLWGWFPSWSRPSVRTECRAEGERGRGKESWGEKGFEELEAAIRSERGAAAGRGFRVESRGGGGEGRAGRRSCGEAVVGVYSPCGFPPGSEWTPVTCTKGTLSVHMVLK